MKIVGVRGVKDMIVFYIFHMVQKIKWPPGTMFTLNTFE